MEQRFDLTLDKEKFINCVYGMLRKMAQAGKEQKYQQISTNLFQTMKKVEVESEGSTGDNRMLWRFS